MKNIPFLIPCHVNGNNMYINLNNVSIISKDGDHCKFSYVSGGLTITDESIEKIIKIINSRGLSI